MLCTSVFTCVPWSAQFEKGWIVKNDGTKKWKHTRLVHQGGFKPRHSEVAVPDVNPGQSVEVRVQYPAVRARGDIHIIER